MDRRKFLAGASAGIGAAALGAFVKPAPTPFSEIPKGMPLAEWALVLDPRLSAGEVMQAHWEYFGEVGYA